MARERSRPAGESEGPALDFPPAPTPAELAEDDPEGSAEPSAFSPDGDDDRERRRMDPELRCMAALVRTLDAIPEPARGRVVRWLAARYTDSAG